MKTCEIKEAFGIDALKFSERPDPPLPHGQVRIRVRAVSLTYLESAAHFGKIVITV
jgi:NADPH:quinone reductase-like Zn-dependent oxidoreductase